MLRRLSELETGEECVVVEIRGKGPVARRIADMGIIPGARLKVLRRAPLGDPIELEVRGYNLSLRRSEADLIIVRVVRNA